MSVCYSVAEGYGVYLNKLEQYLDGKNIINEYKKELPEALVDEFAKSISKSKTIQDLNDVLESYLREVTENYPKTKEEVIKLFAENLSYVYDVNEEIIKSVIDENVFEVTCS